MMSSAAAYRRLTSSRSPSIADEASVHATTTSSSPPPSYLTLPPPTLRQRMSRTVHDAVAACQASVKSLEHAPRELYVNFALKFFESYGYFAVSQILVLYLHTEFGVGDLEAGTVYGMWGLCITLWGLATAHINDNLGVRRSLLLGFAVSAVSTFLLAAATTKWHAYVVLFLLLPLGNSMGIPMLTVGIRRYTTVANRGFAFGLYYSVMNIAAFVSGPVVDVCNLGFHDGVSVFGRRVSGNRMVILTASCTSLASLVVTFKFLREIRVTEGDEKGSPEVPGDDEEGQEGVGGGGGEGAARTGGKHDVESGGGGAANPLHGIGHVASSAAPGTDMGSDDDFGTALHQRLLHAASPGAGANGNDVPGAGAPVFLEFEVTPRSSRQGSDASATHAHTSRRASDPPAPPLAPTAASPFPNGAGADTATATATAKPLRTKFLYPQLNYRERTSSIGRQREALSRGPAGPGSGGLGEAGDEVMGTIDEEGDDEGVSRCASRADDGDGDPALTPTVGPHPPTARPGTSAPIHTNTNTSNTALTTEAYAPTSLSAWATARALAGNPTFWRFSAFTLLLVNLKTLFRYVNLLSCTYKPPCSRGLQPRPSPPSLAKCPSDTLYLRTMQQAPGRDAAHVLGAYLRRVRAQGHHLRHQPLHDHVPHPGTHTPHIPPHSLHTDTEQPTPHLSRPTTPHHGG